MDIEGSGLELQRGGKQFTWGRKSKCLAKKKCLLGHEEIMAHWVDSAL